jgi:PAS domain S-box-containing protein
MNESRFPAFLSTSSVGALKIAGLYLLIGALWILFSDILAEKLATNSDILTKISIYKGWGFIIVTALMLYWLIQRHTGELMEDQKKLRLITDAIPALVSYMDADRVYQFSNRAYEDWFGQRADGQKMEVFLGSAVYQTISGYVDEALSGRNVHYQTEIPYKGGPRFVDATYIPDLNASGVPLGYFALVQDITERRQAEEEVRKWAAAFEHCAHGIAIDDPTTNRIVVCNSAFAALHRVRVEDIVHSSILSLYAPSDHNHVRQSVARADQVGHVQFEASMVRRDGSSYPVQMDLVSVRGDDGNILYRVATAQDISERKKAEAEIAYQASILTYVNDAVIATDENFNIRSWNAAAERIYGWSAEEAIGVPAEKLLQTQFSNTTRSEAIRMIQETGQFSEEVTQVRKDGRRLDVDARTVAVRDEQGRITSFISVNREITDRKRAESAVLESEARYHRVLDTMMEGCQIIDFDWKYVYINEVAAAQGKRTSDELLHHTMMEMYPGIEQTELFLVLQLCMQERSARRLENQFLFPDGSVGWFELSIQPAEEGIFILSTDITERKQMENALRQSEQKFSILFEKSAFVGSLSVLADGRIIDVNEAFERAFGYTRQEAVGKTALELGINPDAETQTRIFAALKESNSIHTLETTLKTKSGESRLFSVNIDIVTIDGQKYILNTALDITERKQAEENVQESERRYRELVQNANSAILRWKHDGTITFFNEYAQSLFGYTAEEIVGKDVNILVPKTESTGSDLSELVEEIVQDPERFSHFVNENVCRDGHRVWMAWTNKPIYADNGEVTEILAVGVDITERKRAESQLRYQADLLSYVSDATFSTDDKRTIVSWNRAAEEMYGWSAEEAIGKSVDAVIRSDFTDDQRADAVRMLKETGRFKVVLLQYHRNGDPLWVEGETITLTNEAGQITGFVAVNRNITERKHSEEALHLSQENFARAFNSNPAALTITHVDDGTFLIVNESYTDIMGYQPQEILGKTVGALNIYVNADERSQLIQNLREQGRVRNHELLVRSKSGELRSLMVSMEPILYDNAECIISTFIDITDKKKAEEEIRRLNEDLEARVIERTSQLAAANKELESFSYSVSHDLRAPLRAIDGYTNILMEDYESFLDEEGKRVCGIISRESKRMGRLIDDLLSFSRTGRREIRFQKIDMKLMVDSVFDELLREKDRSRIDLQVKDLPPTTGDSALMRQVWVNLLSNAIKFTSRKERAVIQVESKENEEHIVYIVRDNGAGFEMEYAGKLFGVFQRLHGESEFEGTGVGLAIVQRVIQRHGGRIWAEGKIGEGATFQFMLPKRMEQA